MGRWGEKVPAAVGTVADRFALLQSGALHLKRAFLAADSTGSSTVGTGSLFAEGDGLPLQEGLQGSLGESGRGRGRDLLHSIEIDVESGSVVAASASGDDFAPLGSETTEFLQLLGGEGAACHDASCRGVTTRTGEKMVPGNLQPQPGVGKAVHDLDFPVWPQLVLLNCSEPPLGIVSVFHLSPAWTLATCTIWPMW